MIGNWKELEWLCWVSLKVWLFSWNAVRVPETDCVVSAVGAIRQTGCKTGRKLIEMNEEVNS